MKASNCLEPELPPAEHDELVPCIKVLGGLFVFCAAHHTARRSCTICHSFPKGSMKQPSRCFGSHINPESHLEPEFRAQFGPKVGLQHVGRSGACEKLAQILRACTFAAFKVSFQFSRRGTAIVLMRRAIMMFIINFALPGSIAALKYSIPAWLSFRSGESSLHPVITHFSYSVQPKL